MTDHETSWSLIEAARDGSSDARARFAEAYSGALRAYFAARWARSRLAEEVDDALQEVFVDCLREQGALERSDPERPFRPFLFGVARTIALRIEKRAGRAALAELEGEDHLARETRLSIAFDRAFAVQVMREATELQRARAAAGGEAREKRLELLELRFQQGLSIVEIAERWALDPARVHHLYADARADFREALREVVRRRNGTLEADLDRECDWMLAVLRTGE